MGTIANRSESDLGTSAFSIRCTPGSLSKRNAACGCMAAMCGNSSRSVRRGVSRGNTSRRK